MGICDGKIAVVTGASRGIGAAIARRLASEGARVVISARTLEVDPRQTGSLSETLAAIRADGGEAVAIRCDVSKSDERRHLIAETERLLGPVDILVNNAAVSYILPLEQLTVRRLDLMLEVQVKAPLELIQLVVPQMKQRGFGWILNITSRAANHAYGPPFDAIQKTGFSVYGLCKAALDRMSNALAAELYDSGIAVNALAPWDNVATPGASHHDLVTDFALEDIGWMADAALVLCTGDPAQLTGRVAYSQPLLNELKRRPPLPDRR